MRQILAKAIRKLRAVSQIPYYRDGYEATLRRREDEEREHRQLLETWKGQPEKYMAKLRAISVSEMQMSLRAENCLLRSSIHSLGELVDIMESEPGRFLSIRNLGSKTALEVIEKVEWYGFDTAKVREERMIFQTFRRR